MKAGTEKRAPLIEHIRELRTRFFWSLLFVLAGAVVGYVVHERLLEIIQKPLGQTLYYTAPTGALGFVLKICVVFGILLGLPVIMYHLFAFLGPLLAERTRRLIVGFTFLSVLLAVSGVVFAYVLTLPAALHFLVGFGSSNIKSMITANEYFNFAFAYIVGFAVLFQIPLVMLFVNSVHRLPPGKLLGSLRYVVVLSFLASAVITPTPDPLNQAMMALPAVGLYVVSMVVVIIMNARHKASNSVSVTAPQKTRRRKRGEQPAFQLKHEYIRQPLLPPLPSATVAAVVPKARTVTVPKPMPKPALAIPIAKPVPVMAQKTMAPVPSVTQEIRRRPIQRVVRRSPVVVDVSTISRPHALTGSSGLVSDMV